MGLNDTTAVNWILPGLLVMTWVALTVTRRISAWFFGLGSCAALLCVPAGVIAGRLEVSGAGCGPGNLCFSANEVNWWLNGLFGLLTVAVLAIVSAVVKIFDAVSEAESHGKTEGR